MKLVFVQNSFHGIRGRFVIIAMHGLKIQTRILWYILSGRMAKPLLVPD
jgi:hypothetical protein